MGEGYIDRAREMDRQEKRVIERERKIEQKEQNGKKCV